MFLFIKQQLKVKNVHHNISHPKEVKSDVLFCLNNPKYSVQNGPRKAANS